MWLLEDEEAVPERAVCTVKTEAVKGKAELRLELPEELHSLLLLLDFWRLFGDDVGDARRWWLCDWWWR